MFSELNEVSIPVTMFVLTIQIWLTICPGTSDPTAYRSAIVLGVSVRILVIISSYTTSANRWGGTQWNGEKFSYLYSPLFGQFIKLNRPVQTKLSQSLHSSHKYIVELWSLLRSDLVIISSVYISVFMYILISNKSIKICIKLHLNKNIEEFYSVFGCLLIL